MTAAAITATADLRERFFCCMDAAADTVDRAKTGAASAVRQLFDLIEESRAKCYKWRDIAYGLEQVGVQLIGAKWSAAIARQAFWRESKRRSKSRQSGPERLEKNGSFQAEVPPVHQEEARTPAYYDASMAPKPWTAVRAPDAAVAEPAAQKPVVERQKLNWTAPVKVVEPDPENKNGIVVLTAHELYAKILEEQKLERQKNESS